MTAFALVHGAWHGSWCWERLTPELERAGHRVVAVDLPAGDPSAGLTRYAELTADALGDAEDVIVVGHSLGAGSIPIVATLRPVRHSSSSGRGGCRASCSASRQSSWAGATRRSSRARASSPTFCAGWRERRDHARLWLRATARARAAAA